ncbi:MAG: hypothetical protein AAFV53_23070 [Myxococcota bacterium]
MRSRRGRRRRRQIPKQPAARDPREKSMAERRAQIVQAFAEPERSWLSVINAFHGIEDDQDQALLFEETAARLRNGSPWTAGQRTFFVKSAWMRRGAGENPDELNAALGLARHLVANQPGYSRIGALSEILHSPHGRTLEGITYSPHTRGDETTDSLLRIFAEAPLENLRYLSFRGGDGSRDACFQCFFQSPVAANLEILRFGGSQQLLSFRHLAKAPAIPRLRALSFQMTRKLRDSAVLFLALTPMKRLESLAVAEYATVRRDHGIARAIGMNPHLAGLRALRLESWGRPEGEAALVDALLQAPYLRSLERLRVDVRDPEQLKRLHEAPRFRQTQIVGPWPKDPFHWKS